jgi:PhnB protein
MEIKVPNGYQTVMPYLIIQRADKFLEFCKKIFSATEKMKHLNENDQIMHAEIQIGGSTIMFSEASPEFPVQTAGLYVHVADADETYSQSLNEGAKSIMAPRDQEYGRSGGIVDPCGNTWWITSALKTQ